MKTEYTDSHTHLYLDAFNDDLSDVIERALDEGVTRMLLPNIDSSTLEALHKVCHSYPENCFPMIGLHPTSVKENFEEELAVVESRMINDEYIAIGEIGMDLYWDKTFLKQQQIAFRKQLQWAKKRRLPVVIHARDSFDEIFEIMDQEKGDLLRGVFHSFTGNEDQVKKIMDYDFYIGINGIVSFKNAGLDKVATRIPIDRLLIETDSPFLAPVPKRGKRNESANVKFVAAKLAGLFNMETEALAKITTQNALDLFKRLQK